MAESGPISVPALDAVRIIESGTEPDPDDEPDPDAETDAADREFELAERVATCDSQPDLPLDDPASGLEDDPLVRLQALPAIGQRNTAASVTLPLEALGR